MVDLASTREELLAEVVRLRERVAQLERRPLGDAVQTPLDVSTGLADQPNPHAAMSATDAANLQRVAREAEFRAHLLDVVEQAVIATDIRGRVIYWNGFAERLYGWTRDEALGHAITELIGVAERLDADIVATATRPGGKGWSGEQWVRNKAGNEFPTHVTITPLLGPQGALMGIVGVSHALTEQKRAEQALSESHELLAAFIRHSPIYAFIKEVTPTLSRVLWASENYQDMIGVPGSQMAGKTMQELFPPEFAIKITADDYAVVSGGAVLRLDEDLNDRNYMTIKYPIQLGERSLLAGYTIDITERKRAEQALRESEARYRLLADNTTDGIWTMTLDGRFSYASPAMEQLLGYTPAEFTQMTMVDVVCPGSLPTAQEALERGILAGLAGDRTPITLVIEEPRKDGSTVWVEVAGCPLLDDQGQLTGVLGVSRNITERLRAQDALRASEASYRSLVESTPDVILSFDRHARHLYASPSVEPLTGIPAEDFIGKTHAELGFAEEQCRFWEERIQAVFHAGQPHESEFEYDSQRGHVVFDWRLVPVRDAEGKVSTVLSISRDITATRRAEREYQSLFTEMLDGFALHEILCDDAGKPVDYRFLALNPAFERITGLTAANLVGRTVLEAVPGTDPYWIETYGRVALTGEPAHFEQFHTGLNRHFEVTAYRPALGQFACIFVDVTERKHAEQALRESEALYRLLADNVSDVIWVMNLDGSYSYISPSVLQLRGYTVEEAMQQRMEEVNCPGSIPPLLAALSIAQTFVPGQAPAPAASLDVEMYCKDGTTVWVEATARLMLNEAGEAARIIGVSRDVTERRRAEEALRESEARYRLLADNVSDVIWTMNLDGQFTYVSPSVYHLRGYAPEEVLGQPMESSICPDSLPVAQAALQASLERAARGLPLEPTTLEIEQPRRDGTTVWTEVTANLLLDDAGQPAGILGVTRDITERRRRQQEYHSMVRATLDGFFVVNTQGCFLEVNDAFCRLLGWSHDELLTMRLSDLEVVEDRSAIRAHFERIIQTGHDRFETRHIRKDGSLVDVEISVTYLGGDVDRCYSFVRDITERKRTELAQRAMEELYRGVSEMTADYAYVVRVQPDGRHVTEWASEGFERITGYTVEEHNALADRHLLYHSDDRPRLAARRRRLEAGEESADDYRIITKSGEVRWVHTHVRGEFDSAEGRVTRIIGATQDITATRRAEIALAESEARYRGLFEQTADVVILHDAQGRILDVNQTACQRLGYSREELMQLSLHNVAAPEIVERIPGRIAAILREGSQLFESIYMAKDGRRIPVEIHVRPIEYEGQTAFLSVSRDITERKQAERALLHQRDLAVALGRATSLQETLQLCTEAAIAMASMDAGGVYLANAADGLNLVYHQGLPTDFVQAVTYYPADSPNAVAVRAGQPAYTNMAALSAALGIPMPEIGIKALAVVPIHYEGRALGCLNVASYHLEDVPPLARSSLEALTGLIGQAIARQQAAEALRASEARLRRAEGVAATGNWELDLKAHTMRASDGARAIYGVDGPEWSLNQVQQTVLPEYRPVLDAALRALVTEGKPYDVGFSICRPSDGRIVDIHSIAEYDAASGIVFGVIQDITAYRRAEQALRESEARLRRAEGVAIIGNWEFLLDQDRVRASQGARQVYGLGDREWTITDVQNIPLPEYRPALDAAMRALITEGAPYDVEFKIQRPSDGQMVDIHSIAEYDADKRAVFGIIQDVSAQKRLEEALRESERRYRGLVENSHDIIYTLNAGGVFTFVSPAWTALLGHPVSEVVGQAFQRFVHPDDAAGCLVFLHAVIETGQRQVGIEYRVRHADGTWRWHTCSAVPQRDESGTVIGIEGIARDVTEDKRAAEALRRWAHVFEHSGWGISVGDVNAPPTVTLINPAYARMLGRTMQEMENFPVPDLYPPTERLALPDHIRQTNETGHHTWESVMVRKDGTEFPVLIDATVVYDADGRPDFRVANIQDLTERRNLEQQLSQAQKMEAVGRLAGGIAHDFNNLLTVINGYSDMLLDLLPPDDPMGADLEQIRGAGERAANLTRQLLAFSRRQVLQMRVLDVNTVLDGMAGLLGRIIGEDVELELELAPTLRFVRGDPGQIEQVVMNLAVNARDAMPTGGTLTIRTADVQVLHPIRTARASVAPGDYVVLTVADTGAGMSPEVLEHLFEPFFTTKEVGKGTGLGLAMVYGIVKQSGGEVEVHSQVGQGTAFTIYLPALVAEAQVGAGAAPEALPLGRETILVVEDEEAVRHLTVRMLRELGYGVMEADSGVAAIELFLATHRQIDLVLTDTVMPGMSGPEMVRRLRGHRSDLKVLFTSGYTDGTALRHGMDELQEAFIQKPFTRSELARRVRAVLEG